MLPALQRSPTRFTYRPELDGIRALAVIGVIISHLSSERFGNGYMGVELFFVLSGYLITALMIIEHRNNGRINLRKFYARRALRLLPALYACVLLWAVLGVLTRPELRSEHFLGVLAGATYVSNWVRALSSHTLGPSGYLWSLAVEEQFYLLWPPLMVGLMRFRLRRPGRIAMGFVLTVWVWRVLLDGHGASQARLANGLDTRMDGLLLGAFLAFVLARPPAHAKPRESQPYWRWLSGVLLGLILASWALPAILPSWFYNTRGVSLTSILCIGIIAPIVTTDRSQPSLLRSTLSWPPLVRAGRLSYGLYLWHPVAIFIFGSRKLGLTGVVRVVPTIVCLVGFALLSERFIEKPFLRMKARFSAD